MCPKRVVYGSVTGENSSSFLCPILTKGLISFPVVFPIHLLVSDKCNETVGVLKFMHRQFLVKWIVFPPIISNSVVRNSDIPAFQYRQCYHVGLGCQVGLVYSKKEKKREKEKKSH